MTALDHLHERLVYDRRADVLSAHLAQLIPENARVLDVGCGDGLISKLIQQHRPDVVVDGVDVLVRPKTYVPVLQYDGERLPFRDNAYDMVMFVDVLHHTDDVSALLCEANRVAADAILIKDHLLEGLLAGPTLYFMDWVGNTQHGVAITAEYWPEMRWRNLFAEMGVSVEYWKKDVPLYPWWASWAFGRSLHFIARLGKRMSDADFDRSTAVT